MEACEDKFKSYKQRKEHLIQDHAYPHNYFFAVTKFGIDRRQSMLVEHRHGRRRQPKQFHSKKQNSKDHAVEPAGQGCVTGESKDVPMTDVESKWATKGQQEVAEDVPMIETGQPTKTEPTRDLTIGDAAKLTNTKPTERRTKQESAVVDAEMEGLVGAMSSLKFVPRAIKFGPKQKARR